MASSRRRFFSSMKRERQVAKPVLDDQKERKRRRRRNDAENNQSRQDLPREEDAVRKEEVEGKEKKKRTRTGEPVITLVEDDVHDPIGHLARVLGVHVALEADERLKDDDKGREERRTSQRAEERSSHDRSRTVKEGEHCQLASRGGSPIDAWEKEKCGKSRASSGKTSCLFFSTHFLAKTL